MRESTSDREWWREGVLYQIYVRSFSDSNGDGIGDLRGVIERLDHLEWLGIDGLWLSPINPSPDLDWGYDVSDYRDVHPDLGDLETLDELIAAAGSRGIRIVLDLVPNHTSDRHAWFVDARSSKRAAHRDWYIWADPRADGSPPNNWRSVFGGSAWELDPTTGQYCLHNFLVEQPDLNWWNEQVRREFTEILRFWLGRGVAGFRIDVANGLIHDPELRDNPPATRDDPAEVRRRGQRQVYNLNRPEVHEIYRDWRAIVDGYDPQRILVAETWVFEPEQLARFYGTGDDELHTCFNFSFVFSDFEAEALQAIVGSTEGALPPGAQPAWTASNHDVGRFPTRWCDGHEERSRCALMALLTLRGTPFLYYGDEIGMTDVPVPEDDLLDLVGGGGTAQPSRDGGRTPMQWNPGGGAGFTASGVRPWLPIGDAASRNVADQRLDVGSMLHLCRDLITLRNETQDLRSGSYTPIPSPLGVWAWKRGRETIVALNLSHDRSIVQVGSAMILIGTDRGRDDERVEGALSLGPWEGAVLRPVPS